MSPERAYRVLYSPSVEALDRHSPSVLVALRVPRSLLEAIDREAKRRSVSRSGMIRSLLEVVRKRKEGSRRKAS